ncbi:hypothetical protein [Clostridium cellulovorans]|uniref:Uncharacterized protein n=1 Tax=Clostridium cellulovorans (strain ATCC 35296 / DSM 3052 / OCM 3 / 743B) TaxID=573061 RepID=D9SSC3_CLOC7|nr:hypothetical protein [Clostridium cellulovorans]ADL50520.1 hypothetical protein Clocel_0749 [Clostridium cellulovorans 743B]
MEYILNDTDIFDTGIDKKFRLVIENNIGSFTKDKAYVFKVSFHVNLLNDVRFEKFDILPRVTNKGKIEDKIGDVMSHQLNVLEKILSENNIESYSTTIQGENLEKENMIKIELYEDNSETNFDKRGRRINRIKVSSIIPNLSGVKQNVSRLASERISQIFYDFMNVVKDRKLMSKILGVEETYDDDILIRAFYEQYRELWFTTKQRENELLDLLKERSRVALEEYFEEQSEGN